MPLPLPPLLFFCAASLVWLLPGRAALSLYGDGWGWLAAGLAAGAALFALLPVVALRRARTTITPHHPEQARVLVQSGIYRISRNPMYLSLLLALLALCAWRVSLPGLLPAFGFMYLVERLQIRREEAALAARFGRDYQAYCHTTRRWL